MLRSLFISLSQNKQLRSFSERSKFGRQMSGRFVAGMSIEDVLAACERVNREGIAATLDALGESVTTEPEARASADVYHQLIDAIAARKLNKFAGLSWRSSANGLPVLTDSCAFIDCSVEDIFPAGDHDIVVGRVLDR